jgi:mannose-6-phosphate isomerase-like protein (cupin superfamily)
MKRIVTGVNPHGRSYVASSEEIPTDQPSPICDVWKYEPTDVESAVRGVADAAAWLEPPKGGINWFYAVIPPLSWQAEQPEMQGVDADGFHTTRTVDFDYLIAGELTMVLDEGRVDLEAGDFVIQQATRHAWRNESAEPAVLLALVHTPA